MAKEQITGAEALMRSLEYQGVKTLFRTFLVSGFLSQRENEFLIHS